MITINLRPGLKRKRAGSPFSRIAEGMRGLKTQVRDPLLLVAVMGWVAVIGFLAFIYFGTAKELRALEPQLEEARAENRRYKAFLVDKRRQELIRDSLVSQIQIIRGVDGDRYIWPHLLEEVTKAIPPFTWLIDIDETSPEVATAAPTDSVDTLTPPPAVQFQINGRTIDIQAYTRFLRQLEASPWIMDVTPVSAQTVIEKERAVTAFTIRATYTPADSAYIQTVPLSQSVR